MVRCFGRVCLTLAEAVLCVPARGAVCTDELSRLRWLSLLSLDGNPLKSLPPNLSHLHDVVQVTVDQRWQPLLYEHMRNVSYIQKSKRYDIGHSETFGLRDDMEDGGTSCVSAREFTGGRAVGADPGVLFVLSLLDVLPVTSGDSRRLLRSGRLGLRGCL